jgi:hypothetical protein
MKDLSSLLERISGALGNDQTLKEIVVTTIFEKLKISLFTEDIALKEGTLQIKTSPVKKNEIKLHEAELIALLSERLNRRLTRVLYV